MREMRRVRPVHPVAFSHAHDWVLLLGHTELESTVRYLGIEVDDALEIAEQTDA